MDMVWIMVGAIALAAFGWSLLYVSGVMPGPLRPTWLSFLMDGGERSACHDCGLPYDDDGFHDLVVPHDMWNNHISPTGDGGGLLCPTCMVRAAVRAGVECEAVFRSGPFAKSEAYEVAGEKQQLVRHLKDEIDRIAAERGEGGDRLAYATATTLSLLRWAVLFIAGPDSLPPPDHADFMLAREWGRESRAKALNARRRPPT